VNRWLATAEKRAAASETWASLLLTERPGIQTRNSGDKTAFIEDES